MQQTTQFSAGTASYPPAYNAVGARLDRAWPRYIKARVRDDKALVNLSRAVIDSTIDAAVRDAAEHRPLVDPSGLRGAKRAAANMLNKQGRA